MDTDISCVFEGLGSVGAIYISNQKTANNLAILKKLNIKAVASAAKGRKIQFGGKHIQRYLYLQIEDHEDFKIEDYFEDSFAFIDQARKFSNVLIHCHVGASRSVTIVMAYLIRKYQYSLPQIYSLIKRKRPKIEPNQGFINQLQKYAKKFAIYHSQLYFSIKKFKSQVKRSLSLTATPKSQAKNETLTNQNSKSETLNDKSSKKQEQQKIFQDEKQKIAFLYKQRQQIQEKLQLLRCGLIKSRNLKRIKAKYIETKILQIDDKNLIFTKAQNVQNNDPNQFYLTQRNTLNKNQNMEEKKHKKGQIISQFKI